MKVDMKSTDYYQSGEHVKNVIAAREKALLANERNKKDRIDAYNTAPTICVKCNKELDYAHRKNKYCSRSCSAQLNNLKRTPRTEESRARTGDALRGRKMPRGQVVVKRISKVQFPTCTICDGYFLVRTHSKHHRKTCSRRCSVVASTSNRTYQNGSRKPEWFFNPNEGKEVLLESSWEVLVAKKLISCNIRWIRPSPLDWVDAAGIGRLYYPDFYLCDYGLYLDPKNPYCMEKDREKMACVSDKVSIIYGDIDIILSHIDVITEK